MPTLTRWFLRAALLHLLVSLLLAVVAALPSSQASSLGGALRPAWIHLVVMGWATQMIFGVAWWMFPRPGQKAGPELPGWFCFGTLNAGLVLRAVSEPLMATRPGRFAGALLAVSALLLFASVLIFVVLIWRRVAPR